MSFISKLGRIPPTCPDSGSSAIVRDLTPVASV